MDKAVSEAIFRIVAQHREAQAAPGSPHAASERGIHAASTWTPQ